MFKFLKSKKKSPTAVATSTTEVAPQAETAPLTEIEASAIETKSPVEQVSAESSTFAAPSAESESSATPGLFAQLTQKIGKTRQKLVGSLANLILGKKQIDDALLEELETILLLADVGVTVTEKILKELAQRVERRELNDPERLMEVLQNYLETLLLPYSQPLTVKADVIPFVILMIGVNGAGKTTSIAKLANYYQHQGKRVMLAAGDTFRAAAVEQLQVWGERIAVPVIAQQTGSDSASVIYDALQSAKARNYDLLIADTAGRLHTQSQLMAELAKIKRVMTKIDAQAPHEVLLVIDATMGQNALVQAEQFHQMIGLTGICLTKLDGTAKGGIIFAIADQLKLPIRFIGLGEHLEDLKPFDAKAFVAALFAS